MKRVFIYTRVSTNEQLSGGGLARQKETCLNFCSQKGWSVIRDFQEQESGSISAMERPLLAEAISLCGVGTDVHTIIVERADRIARDLIVSELFFRECRNRNIEVYAADSGEELVNAEADPTRKLIRQVLGALAEWSKAEIAKKLLAGRKRMKEKTGFPCGGTPPFGMKEGEKKWVWRVLFEYRKGQPLPDIARTLNYGPAYRTEKIRYWTPRSVERVIKSWNHRAEFSLEKMRELCEGSPQTLVVFPLTPRPENQS